MPRPPYEYSPITEREFDLPEGNNVALWVVPNIEHFDFENPRELHRLIEGPPDVNDFSWREYGTRVGIWRLMKILDSHDVRATVALNADVCTHEPEIVEAGVERDWEFMGHGQTNSRPLNGLSESEERAVIRATKETIQETTGVAPRGWLGPARAETYNTPRLLVEEGFDYVGDFVNDDQPYPMTTEAGRIYSIPYTTEINDIGLFTGYNMSGPEFEQCLTDQFDVLYEEGKEPGNAKVMAISLHPYLTGLPYRSKYLDNALSYITDHPDVWLATGSEIIDHYMEQYG